MAEIMTGAVWGQAFPIFPTARLGFSRSQVRTNLAVGETAFLIIPTSRLGLSRSQLWPRLAVGETAFPIPRLIYF